MPDTLNALHAARLHADASWQMFALSKALPDDTIPEWEEITTEGGPLLSGRLVGPRPAWTLERFARGPHLHLVHPGDQHPFFDVDQPGRTVLVWRYGGVWVELWHPDTVVDAPEGAEPGQDDSVPSVAVPSAPEPTPERVVPALTGRRSFLGPGGRLFFTRKSRTTNPKETSTR